MLPRHKMIVTTTISLFGKGRVRATLLVLALLLAIALAWTLFRGTPDQAVELSAAPPQPAAAQPLAPPIMPAAASTPPPQAPSPPAPAIPNLILRGVTGGGPGGGAAIFDAPGGAQRVVRIGRPIAEGVVLAEVRIDHVIASVNGGSVRLDIGKSGGAALAGASGAPSSGGKGARASAANAGSLQRETMDYRLGLQPMKSGTRTAGYAVRPDARLPHLSKAGLQPGDVILRVNGSEMDEERLMELSWQIANSENTEIEYSRGGKTLKTKVR